MVIKYENTVNIIKYQIIQIIGKKFIEKVPTININIHFRRINMRYQIFRLCFYQLLFLLNINTSAKLFSFNFKYFWPRYFAHSAGFNLFANHKNPSTHSYMKPYFIAFLNCELNTRLNHYQ